MFLKKKKDVLGQKTKDKMFPETFKKSIKGTEPQSRQKTTKREQKQTKINNLYFDNKKYKALV